MEDFIVIGGGIVGTTIGLALRNTGMKGQIVDDGRSMGGTAPSGGHLKPSWLGGMSKQQYEPAIELLADTWDLLEEQFVIRPTGIKTTVYRIDTDKVLAVPKLVQRARKLGDLKGFPMVSLGKSSYRCKLLVIAAGVWCNELVETGLEITLKQGVSFRVAGKVTPFIKPWAPYKQVVAHQQNLNSIWIGDGSTILAKNWTPERTQQCRKRCATALGSNRVQRTITGIRPYVKKLKGVPCVVKQIYKRVWVATGAGKLGTIAAGWAARRILDATV